MGDISHLGTWMGCSQDFQTKAMNGPLLKEKRWNWKPWFMGPRPAGLKKTKGGSQLELLIVFFQEHTIYYKWIKWIMTLLRDCTQNHRIVFFCFVLFAHKKWSRRQVFCFISWFTKCHSHFFKNASKRWAQKGGTTRWECCVVSRPVVFCKKSRYIQIPNGGNAVWHC